MRTNDLDSVRAFGGTLLNADYVRRCDTDFVPKTRRVFPIH
jgi:hypothetical protein